MLWIRHRIIHLLSSSLNSPNTNVVANTAAAVATTTTITGIAIAVNVDANAAITDSTTFCITHNRSNERATFYIIHISLSLSLLRSLLFFLSVPLTVPYSYSNLTFYHHTPISFHPVYTSCNAIKFRAHLLTCKLVKREREI